MCPVSILYLITLSIHPLLRGTLSSPAFEQLLLAAIVKLQVAELLQVKHILTRGRVHIVLLHMPRTDSLFSNRLDVEKGTHTPAVCGEHFLGVLRFC